MRNMKKQPFFNLFKKKRRTNGTFWVSLLGLGISAAVFGITKGKRKETTLPFQSIVKNFTQRNVNKMDNTALTEFSEELLSSALNKKGLRKSPQKITDFF